jgi:hypothetical protein
MRARSIVRGADAKFSSNILRVRAGDTVEGHTLFKLP